MSWFIIEFKGGKEPSLSGSMIDTYLEYCIEKDSESIWDSGGESAMIHWQKEGRRECSYVFHIFSFSGLGWFQWITCWFLQLKQFLRMGKWAYVWKNNQHILILIRFYELDTVA